MLWISSVVMVLFWVFCVTVLALIAYAAYADDMFSWDVKRYFVAFSLSILALVVIPFQWVRYFRELRTLE